MKRTLIAFLLLATALLAIPVAIFAANPNESAEYASVRVRSDREYSVRAYTSDAGFSVQRNASGGGQFLFIPNTALGTADGGIGSAAAGVLKITDGSSAYGSLQAKTLALAASSGVAYTTSATDPSVTVDVALQRSAAGILIISDGSTGYGSLKAKAFTISADSTGQGLVMTTSATDPSVTADAGLSRSGAGVLKITDASVGLGGLIVGGADATGLGFGTMNVNISIGTGSPETVVTANIGSLFLRTDGSTNTTLYVKTANDASNVGWTAK